MDNISNMIQLAISGKYVLEQLENHKKSKYMETEKVTPTMTIFSRAAELIRHHLNHIPQAANIAAELEASHAASNGIEPHRLELPGREDTNAADVTRGRDGVTGAPLAPELPVERAPHHVEPEEHHPVDDQPHKDDMSVENVPHNDERPFHD